MKSEDIIQRYMNLPKFMYLLQENSLFLPKMSIFEDKLEGGLTARSYLETSNDAKIFDLAMNYDSPAVGGESALRKVRLNNSTNIKKQLHERTFESPFGTYPCDDAQKLFPRCREWLYVSCWHRSPYECSAMWQLYGEDKNAICILTTVDKLNKQLIRPDNIDTLELRDVAYIDHANAKFDKDKLTPFLSKSLPFNFEKELRIVGFDSNLNLNDSDENNKKGINVEVKSLPQLIDSIIISPNSDSWFAKAIQKLCNEFKLDITVQTSSLRIERTENLFMAIEQLQKNDSTKQSV